MPHIQATKRPIIPIVLIFLSFSSCGQTKNNEIESILLDCLTKSYGEQQIDIDKEFDLLEKKLIENKSLKSSTGQSYFDFYQEIVNHNAIPATLDYDRFDNIFKLTPSQFYSIDCLEELKMLDSTAIANSKYSQMTVAVQKAVDEEVSPSSVAKAITSVLSPSDFDKPYYRAIALLTIAYTASPEIGLERKLVPTDNEDYSHCEVMTISTTDKNQIFIDGSSVNLEELETTLKDFIETNKSNHLIKFQPEMGTYYEFYLKIEEAIKTVYTDLRDDLAIEKFNKPSKELNENELKEISNVYPFRLNH
jgi:biopolymer transport protein ExbD